MGTQNIDNQILSLLGECPENERAAAADPRDGSKKTQGSTLSNDDTAERLVSQGADFLADLVGDMPVFSDNARIWTAWREEVVGARITKVPYRTPTVKSASNDPKGWLTRGVDLPGFGGERLAQFPGLSLEGDGALKAER